MLNVKRGSVLTHWPFFVGPASALSAIILAIISFLSGLGWMLDRKKHRQEIESLKADNRQNDMELSKDYVTEWRTYIAEPLAIAFLLRASAIPERAQMALGLASVSQ